MTRADLFEAGSDRYQELKAKIQHTSNIEEKRQLQLKILTLLDGMLYIMDKMKHLQ